MVRSEERIERYRASALDLLMAAQGEAGTKNIAIDKKLIADVFFQTQHRPCRRDSEKITSIMAGGLRSMEIFAYTGKPLKDFIYESNKRKTAFFIETEEEAVNRLTKKYLQK